MDFNRFFQEMMFTNYGNNVFVIYGRDIACFVAGYLMCFCIGAIIECFKEKNNEHKDKRNGGKG